MARYESTLTNQNDAIAINLANEEAESLLIQASGGTTPALVLEVSLDGGTTWDDVEVEDLDALGTALDTFGAGLFQPRASHFGAATQARVRRTDANGGNTKVVASTGR